MLCVHLLIQLPHISSDGFSQLGVQACCVRICPYNCLTLALMGSANLERKIGRQACVGKQIVALAQLYSKSRVTLKRKGPTSAQRQGCEEDRDLLPTTSINVANEEDRGFSKRDIAFFQPGPVFIQQRADMNKAPAHPRFARPAGIKEALRCSRSM